jgi:hypothetical protein
MAEPASPNEAPTSANGAAAAGAPRSKDEVALELMKFIAVATGYGKSLGSSAGFSGKPVAHSAEEHADALLELFERCRRVVNKGEQGPTS